jgi:hypothetical protein
MNYIFHYVSSVFIVTVLTNSLSLAHSHDFKVVVQIFFCDDELAPEARIEPESGPPDGTTLLHTIFAAITDQP